MTDYKLVPVEPTEEMYDASFVGRQLTKEFWDALLSAAPPAPQQTADQIGAIFSDVCVLSDIPMPFNVGKQLHAKGYRLVK